MSIHTSQYGKYARIAVVLSGVLLFAGLYFADKSNLTNKKNPSLNTPPSNTASTSQPNDLPPLSPDASTDKWLAKLKDSEGKAKVEVLDSVISQLQKRKRFDHAAQYAEMRLKVDSSLTGQKLAANLFYDATHLEHISKDSLLFEKFSNKAISYLEKVKATDSTDEQVLIALGKAYIESRNPQNSMKGILTIRKVTEINPNNVDAAMQLGLFSMQTGQFEKAVARFEKVLSIQKNNELAQFQLANAYLQTGRKEDAQKLLKPLSEKAENVEVKEQAIKLLQSL